MNIESPPEEKQLRYLIKHITCANQQQVLLKRQLKIYLDNQFETFSWPWVRSFIITEKSLPARIKGNTTHIIASAALNLLSAMDIGTYTLSTFVELNIGYASLKSSNKSRLIAIDLGIDVPNLAQTLKSISEFCDVMRKGEFSTAFDLIFNRQNFESFLSFLRWLIRSRLLLAGQAIDTVWNTIMFVTRSAPELYRQCCELYEKKGTIEVSDIISIIVTGNNTITAGASLVSQYRSLAQNLRPVMDLPESKSDHVESESKHTASKAVNTVLDLAAFLPSTNDESVIRVALGGLHLMPNGTMYAAIDRVCLTVMSGFNLTNIFLQASQDSVLSLAGNFSAIGDSLRHSGFSAAYNESVSLLYDQKESGKQLSKNI